MRTIPETIEFHRATRARYMSAARSARSDRDMARAFPKVAAQMFADRYAFAGWQHLTRVIVPSDAMRCFVRRAREANRKLVILKYFTRRLSWDISLGYEPNGDELDHLLGGP